MSHPTAAAQQLSRQKMLKSPLLVLPEYSRELEAPISRDEIRRAVWDCGENKSPRFWNIVGPDLCLAVEWFFHHATFSVGCNSSFIALIPKTLNPKSVGENMSSIRAWDETVNKLKLRLSSWKLKTLSIGGRLTLLKSVLRSTPIYNMSLFKVPKAVLKSMESIRLNFFNGIRDGEKKIAWVSWSKVLASKSNGGLGVSSFYALNRGLLFKVGNGMSTSFWHDRWLGDSCLRLSYPRLFYLKNNKVCTVAAKMSALFVSSLRRDVRGGEESAQLSRISDLLDTVVLSNMGDRRFWDLNGDGCFHVKDVRRMLDDMLLPKSNVSFRWVKQIPIKVSPISCPICYKALENLDHLLFCCDLAKDIARSICNWWAWFGTLLIHTNLGYLGRGYKELIPESFVNLSELLEKHDNRSTKEYHEVPPPLTGNYMPLKRDLKLIDEHFECESVDVSTVSSKVPKSVMKKNFGPPIIEDWHSDDERKDKLSPTVEVKTVKPSKEKIESIKTPRETVKTTESHKPHKHYPTGNKRNWNNLMSHRLGSNFKMINKACYVCGIFEHLQYVCDKKDVSPLRNNSNMVNHKKIANKFTHPHPKKGLVSQAVLTRSAKINIAAASVNTVQTRPFNKLSSNKRSVFNKKVNTVRVNDSTARERSIVSGNMGSKVNAIKASGNPQQKEYKEKEVIDSGCSRHMTPSDI
nr:RNA-directed DNA polymerase, eukaryota [Tanacetum cinerariifolium]